MGDARKLALVLAGGMLVATPAAAQTCDPAERESGSYLVLNAGDRDNAKAKCVVGGTRCEIQFAKDTSSFTLVQVASAPGQTTSKFRRADGSLRWKAELFANNVIDTQKKFVLTTDNPRETQEFTGGEIETIDDKKYRVTLSEKMEAALAKAKNVSWAFTESGRTTTLTFSLSGSEKTLKWIRCVQSRPLYLTSCETTNVRVDWIARHRAVRDANEVLKALNSQIAIYPADDFGHDEATRDELRKEAVALFKSAREAYDGFFGRVAARTTRACEVCDLKALYQLATQAGLVRIHENQLKEFIRKPDLLTDLRLLANTNSTLEITRAKLKNMSISDPAYGTVLAQVGNLERDVQAQTAQLLDKLPRPTNDPFQAVLAGYQCDIR
jgi:hypothetical protein